MAEASPIPAPLVVFSDDWGRHPSSCQHLVRHLLARHRVCWVNTIGTRRPRLDRASAARGWEKARQWLLPRRSRVALPAGLTVLNPAMWPFFTRRLDRRINRFLLGRYLRPLVATSDPPPVAVTTLPLVADLIDVLPIARWVYYCVDDFSQWPGLDHGALAAMEERLIRRADVIVAVSRTLQDRIARQGRAAVLLTHGVDLEHWRSLGGQRPAPLPPDLARPLVVFWGVIDRRMDAPFVRRLAAEMQDGTLLLVGPQESPDPSLVRLPRVRMLPPVPYADLPALAREAAVLVMPYADLPVTRAMQPLKLTEYLASGRPVVARRLPSTEPWHDALDLADSTEEFAQAVLDRLRTDLPDAQAAARRRLAEESWAAKACQFERVALAAEPALPADCEDADAD